MRIGRARVGGASPSRPTEPELDPAREAEEFAHTRARKRPTKRPARPPEVIPRCWRRSPPPADVTRAFRGSADDERRPNPAPPQHARARAKQPASLRTRGAHRHRKRGRTAGQAHGGVRSRARAISHHHEPAPRCALAFGAYGHHACAKKRVVSRARARAVVGLGSDVFHRQPSLGTRA